MLRAPVVHGLYEKRSFCSFLFAPIPSHRRCSTLLSQPQSPCLSKPQQLKCSGLAGLPSDKAQFHKPIGYYSYPCSDFSFFALANTSPHTTTSLSNGCLQSKPPQTFRHRCSCCPSSKSRGRTRGKWRVNMVKRMFIVQLPEQIITVQEASSSMGKRPAIPLVSQGARCCEPRSFPTSVILSYQ
ncbi:hypothetical protein BDBG_16504 [Blastomyces gilchristii SLH14081]|uniref:Uncharacterized protein n=1 Tax=Blastomyces gilchristii (strain SLH14081) TaxID=559298 RepID=A0A179UCY8_BLAGS|nr:uncharacterized protein BDBG_16504 [Blastomyces gilchristii SLH14081]OAT05866.1 hypothetical protein BDBG_16504 [Blastomyces gilchristii SLH14081]